MGTQILIDTKHQLTLDDTTLVTTANGTQDVLSTVAYWQCPEGEAWRFPGRFMLKPFRLRSDATTQIPQGSQFCVFIHTKNDTHRRRHMGALKKYDNWYALPTDAKQNDSRMNSGLAFDLGIPVLAIQPGERIGIGVISNPAVDISECYINLPYEQTTPGVIERELVLRRQILGA